MKQWFKKYVVVFGFVVTLAWLCVCMSESVRYYPQANNMEEYRTFKTDNVLLEELSEKYGWGTASFCSELSVQMIQLDMIQKNKGKLQPILIKRGILKPLYVRYKNMYHVLLADIECFPVCDDVYGGEIITFTDTWGSLRTFGGKRRHEGTDVMAGNNKRGYFPIVSMTQGIVEKKGWLPQGGWRLGIRSPSGAYFYYAHLYAYAKGIEVGSNVRAGQMIGYMGDSGYGEEGTIGKFDVHLHMGFYLSYKGKEMSVNPYYILKYYENKKRKFYNKC